MLLIIIVVVIVLYLIIHQKETFVGQVCPGVTDKFNLFSNTLVLGTRLNSCDALKSGNYILAQSSIGALLLFNKISGTVIWRSTPNTTGHSGPFYTMLSSRGLITYDSKNLPVWSVPLFGSIKRLTLRDDGILQIINSSGYALWSTPAPSLTSPPISVSLPAPIASTPVASPSVASTPVSLPAPVAPTTPIAPTVSQIPVAPTVNMGPMCVGGNASYNIVGESLRLSGELPQCSGISYNNFKLVQQSDGNLVVFDSSGNQRWSSNLSNRGVPPFKSTMKPDGNLCIYDSTGKMVWCSMTNDKNAAYVTIAGNGQLWYGFNDGIGGYFMG